MKKIIIVALLTCFLAAAGFAQDFNNPQIIEKLGLTQQQVEQLTLIYEEAKKIIREARLDIDIEKALLRKELAQRNVNLKQVQGRLKSIVDLEYEVRLAEITREVKVRELIGDAAWIQFRQITRERKEAGATTRDRAHKPETEPSQTQDSKSKR